ncbi:S-adenosyl-L-methionine-dependent methyltransferase [Hypoxylon trugodes]|uniref:S-adenosyl-L-methionine-dependent methyltransferase n=1 Tax=Hypoxylon trugodes TaxID=326681 RepID=UPI00219D9D91|nr:S-adenosyl-L-methionine-dependent methyltransferase [Hypoxylon trugodes]KAI1389631.1 S-adenosyl-L-methionine-dependent methyltransferase [Hypoxylon trugodes]
MPSLLSRTIEATQALLFPWVFLALSASCLPGTILRLIREGRFATLFYPRALRDAWFTDFWGRIAGPGIRRDAAVRVIPLLQGRVDGGRVVERQVSRGIGGTVIEVGVGSGMWVDVYREVADISSEGESEVRRRNVGKGGDDGNASKGVITRVYGVEPNEGHHAALQKNIAKAGLEDVYRIVPVGIEDLDNPEKWDGKVEKGSVDCIVSILCLCSIPDPEKNIRELYSYLKKGGRWYAYEHVRVEYSWYMKAYQRYLNLFWPHFIGGCTLCRQTEKTIREAGSWEDINIGQPPDEFWYKTVPHRLGIFTK